MLGTFLPRDGKALVLANGAYGLRIAQTLRYMGGAHTVIDKGDYLPPSGADVAAALEADPGVAHVVLVHCETSSGILNPVEKIVQVTAEKGRSFLLDSMSAFGALPLDLSRPPCEAVVSSANKCMEGVPGFGFVLARKQALAAAEGRCHSLSLDLAAQWSYMEKTGQWRCTPPTHAVAAFLQALDLHAAEGGAPGRLARYTANRDALVGGMRRLGFETLLEDRWLSPIIVTFFNPAHAGFQFGRFYDLLKARGFIIYSGKLTAVDSFRIGCIGRVDAGIMRRLAAGAGEALAEMGVDKAGPPAQALAERERLRETAA